MIPQVCLSINHLAYYPIYMRTMIFISKCLLPVFSFHFRSTAYYTGPNFFLCLDYYPALAFWLRAVFTIAKSKQILWTGPRFCISLSADKKKVEVKSCAKLYIPSTINTCLEVLPHKWGLGSLYAL